MKYLNFLILFFSFSLYLTKGEEVNNSTENTEESYSSEISGELKNLRESNNKKFNQIINDYIKEHKYNKNIITREQFKEIFYKLFEIGRKELSDEEGKEIKENKEYINNIFNNLIKEEKKEIEVDKIIDLFEPQNILFALRDSLNDVGLNNAVDSLSQDLLHALDALEEENKKKENEKNTDL